MIVPPYIVHRLLKHRPPKKQNKLILACAARAKRKYTNAENSGITEAESWKARGDHWSEARASLKMNTRWLNAVCLFDGWCLRKRRITDASGGEMDA